MSTRPSFETKTPAAQVVRENPEPTAQADTGKLEEVKRQARVLFSSRTLWSAAGLENPLYACLLTLSALLYLRELDSPRPGLASAYVLVAVALTRPEGIAFACVFLGHRLLVRARRTAQWTAIIAVSCALFVLWRHWYFSAWLPSPTS